MAVTVAVRSLTEDGASAVKAVAKDDVRVVYSAGKIKSVLV